MRVFAKVLQASFSKLVELSARQKAFIPAEGVANNIFALRELIQNARTRRSGIDVAFVDVTKAFDTIPHSAFWNAIARRGVPDNFIGVVREMYNGANTRITSRDEMSADIPIRSGVKQGCPLSPFLFNLVIDNNRAVHQAPSSSHWQ